MSRSSLERRRAGARPAPKVDEVLAERIRRLIHEFPTFGYRRLWALLRFRDGVRVNRKTVYRILRLKGWFVHQRQVTPRPRVRVRRSRADASDERWAMDVTRVHCGDDGWGHLSAVIDCHDREIVGFEFALRGRAREAERALEEACAFGGSERCDRRVLSRRSARTTDSSSRVVGSEQPAATTGYVRSSSRRTRRSRTVSSSGSSGA